MLGNLAPATRTRLGAYGSTQGTRALLRTSLGLAGSSRTVALALVGAGSVPSISGVTGVAYLGSMVISGTNFGALQTGAATVTVGGVTQTVNTWSNTTLTINSLARGGLPYGVSVSVQVTNSVGGTTSFTLTTGLQPQTGWYYVNVTSINPYLPGDMQTSPAIAIGDQIAWGNVTGTGTATVYADTSFSASSIGVHSFQFEVNSSGAWSPSLGTVTLATQLMGAMTSTSLATGVLTTAITMAAAATDVSSATGALTTGFNLGGALTDVSTATGALTTAIKLLGAAVSNSTGQGTLGGGVQLAGAAVSNTSATGNLSTTISLIGAMVDVSTAAGNLATQILLAASAGSVSVASGSLTVLGQQLAGAAAVSSTATGTLSTAINIAGALVDLTAATGALTAQIQLAAYATSNSNASAALTVPTGQSFAGAATSVSSAAGQLTTLIKAMGVAFVQTTVTGSLSTGITLQAAAYDASLATGALNAPGSPVGIYTIDLLYDISYESARWTQSFPQVMATDSVVLTWNFANRLAAGEYLNGRIGVTVTCSAGTDPNPSDLLVGPAAYDTTQINVSQPVANGIAGNEYLFAVTAATSNPNKSLTMYGLLPVQG